LLTAMLVEAAGSVGRMTGRDRDELQDMAGAEHRPDGTPSEPVLAARFDDLPDYVEDGAPG
jgi:hypothetical protein